MLPSVTMRKVYNREHFLKRDISAFIINEHMPLLMTVFRISEEIIITIKYTIFLKLYWCRDCISKDLHDRCWFSQFFSLSPQLFLSYVICKGSKCFVFLVLSFCFSFKWIVRQSSTGVEFVNHMLFPH